MDWAFAKDGMDLSRYIWGMGQYASPIGLLFVVYLLLLFWRAMAFVGLLEPSCCSANARSPCGHGGQVNGTKQAQH